MSEPERALRRLRYETKDWCNAVRGVPSPGTHRALVTAQHSPEVWARE